MDDSRDLIDRLCTLAGMIMEDASADAVVLDARAEELQSRIEGIRSSATDAASLTEAAIVVARRFNTMRI